MVEDIVAAYVELRERPEELFVDTVEASRRRAIQGARLCRLVKSGRIVEDRFVRWLDDGPAPDDIAVIVPRERLLAEAGLIDRAAPTGVLWPNDRDDRRARARIVDRLALVALVFPVFRDGRAYSQARILRERYGFRGELRATGQVLRDQFLFMLRAGFDAFEVTKDADAAAFRRGDPPLQRVLPADRRRPEHGPPVPPVRHPGGGAAGEGN